MDFLRKLGKFLMDNIVYTVILVVALAYFLILSKGIVTGILITISALLICFVVSKLYGKYKKLPASEKPTIKDIKTDHKKPVAKKAAKKAPAKKAPAKKKPVAKKATAKKSSKK